MQTSGRELQQMSDWSSPKHLHSCLKWPQVASSPLRVWPKAAAGISRGQPGRLGKANSSAGILPLKPKGNANISTDIFLQAAALPGVFCAFRYRQGPAYITLLELLALNRKSCCSKHILPQSTPWKHHNPGTFFKLPLVPGIPSETYVSLNPRSVCWQTVALRLVFVTAAIVQRGLLAEDTAGVSLSLGTKHSRVWERRLELWVFSHLFLVQPQLFKNLSSCRQPKGDRHTVWKLLGAPSRWDWS